MQRSEGARVLPLRSMRAHGPMIVVAALGDPTGDRIQHLLTGNGWTCVRAADQDRVQWVASVQKPTAVVVVSNNANWASDVLIAARGATMAAVLFVGRLASSRVIGLLDAGTDAIVSDELCDAEIMARVLAVVRRTSIVQEPGVRYLVAGPLRVDLWARAASLNGEPLQLSPTEYTLLVFLMRQAGRLVSPTKLIDGVWGWSEGDGLNTLRIFIARLRRKLGDDARGSKFIRSMRGHGYSFVATVVEQGADSTVAIGGQAQLLESVARMVSETTALKGNTSTAQFIVQTLVSEGTTDAAAILRINGGRLELIADEGLSTSWRDAVCPSIPLDSKYASVQAIEHQEPEQVFRLSATRPRCAQTAALLAVEGTPVGLFMPIMANGRCWGAMGALRRCGQPYSPATVAYFRAALAIYGTTLSLN